LAIEKLFPICSPKFATAHSIREARDLARVVLLEREMIEGWVEWFAASGVMASSLPSIIRMRDATAVIEAAIAGQGVALGNDSLVAFDLYARRLVRLVASELVSAFAYYFVCLPSALERQSVDRFRRWVALEMERQNGAG
jgi:LysR family glycine cleavage system transcriptional activator